MIKIIREIKKELGKDLQNKIEGEARSKVLSNPNSKKILDTFNKNICYCNLDSEKAYLAKCRDEYFNKKIEEESNTLAIDKYQKMQEKYVRLNLGISHENGKIKLYHRNEFESEINF